jgi:hypothetical protein
MDPKESHGEWRRRHAWGLPAGSVRALLALLVFATTWALLVLDPSRPVPAFLRDLLFIILGHYFASRGRAESSGQETGPPPLYLPAGSVRLLLVLGCVVVAVVLQRRGQLIAPGRHPGVVTLLLIGGFLLGVALNTVATRLRRGRPPLRVVEDLRALISVVAAVLLIGLVLNRYVYTAVPQGQIQALAASLRLGSVAPESVLAAVVGFYFGSRS